ncbi:hypothetical protein HXX76_002014 [Chlamydomonas incerta]|uniref:peptidylprolyl isomerase n=1 Tax=Chlamydomonas incerta TaxID=51695 RepID=A0A835WA97_CHLIN|nr:hypothetical protein HXX76_002014 [Chlamydomonas incerta]|eukprot:KAG2443665.1 hypothetical protein HXX76_002014 [Chlamydomonas incerta]
MMLSQRTCRAPARPFSSKQSSRSRCTILARAGAGPSEQQLRRTESVAGSLDRRQLLAALAGAGIVSSVLPPSEASAADGASVVGPPEGNAYLLSSTDVAALNSQEKLVLNLNRRIQTQNRVPVDFPGFIREGFDVKVVGEGYQVAPSGLIYKDFEEGTGSLPLDGQEVVFNYTGYNESGSVIDTSFRQGRPAQTRLGVNGMIPGFELGVKTMKPGGKRRIIVPPALGPPVGPSTFFSAKQCEVFDVELLAVRTCTRRQVMMFSDLVCE